jgi:mannose-6-phosphate isomerase-like protein (cupin superfamily)
MNRRLFLQLPLVAPALAFALPPLADPTAADRQPPKKGILVKAGQDRFGKSLTYLDARFDIKVSGKDTEGRCVIFDTIRNGKVGPTLHVHDDCDEWFFVMDGAFKVQVGEETFRLTAGDSLLGPMGVPHAFVKTSDGPARLMLMHQPAARMEEFFYKASQLVNPTLADRQALIVQYGMRVVGPPLTPD